MNPEKVRRMKTLLGAGPGSSSVWRLRLALTLLLAAVLGWLYMAGHGRYGLFDVDEAIFTQATREMLHNAEREPVRIVAAPVGHPGEVQPATHGVTQGVLATAMPTYNGEPRYHKPPLIYWVQAGMMSLLGEDSLWAARLPSALSALATVALLGWWTARVTGSARWGLLAAMVMGLNISFIVVGRAATADGVLNLAGLAVTLSLISLMYAPAGPRGAWLRRWGPALTGVLAALALLAKGPVALLPCVLVGAVVLVMRRPTTYPDRLMLWRQINPWLIGGVTLLGLLPWLILMVSQSGGAFFYEFIYVHNVQRFAGGFKNSQSSSYFYYLAVLMVGFAPWVLMLPGAAWWALKNLRGRLASTDMAQALPAVALVWALGYVFIFSFSQTKLAHYIVPAYPALAILIGGWLQAYITGQVREADAPVQGERVEHWTDLARGAMGALWLTLLGLILMAVGPLLEALRNPELDGGMAWLQSLLGFRWPPKDMMTRDVLWQQVPLDPAAGFAGLVLLTAVVPAYLLLWHHRPRRAGGPLAALAFSWAVVLGLISWGVVPMVWRYTQAPLVRLAAEISAAAPGVPIVHLGLHKPSVLYLSQRPFLKLERPLQLPDYLHAPRTLVLTERDKVAGIRQEIGVLQQPGAQITRQHCDGGYCLLTIERTGTR